MRRHYRPRLGITRCYSTLASLIAAGLLASAYVYAILTIIGE